MSTLVKNVVELGMCLGRNNTLSKFNNLLKNKICARKENVHFLGDCL